MNRILIVQESDHHGGNKLGLMNPDTILQHIVWSDGQKEEQEYKPEMTESQKALWELRQENIQKVIELADGCDVHYIQDGDPTQGNKHQADLVSDRMSNQIKIAFANDTPIFEIPNLKSALFAAGTGAHNFGMGSADELIVDRLKDNYKEIPIKLCYHGLVHYGEFTVDFAHHGPYVGSREWLKGNVARYYLQSTMLHSIKKHQKPADLYVRGHYHVPVIETVRLNGYTSHIVVSPSMCMVDDFAHQAAKSPEDVTCGMFVYEIVNDKLLDVHEFTRTWDTRTEYHL